LGRLYAGDGAEPLKVLGRFAQKVLKFGFRSSVHTTTTQLI
jgi:hypothetical protein